MHIICICIHSSLPPPSLSIFLSLHLSFFPLLAYSALATHVNCIRNVQYAGNAAAIASCVLLSVDGYAIADEAYTYGYMGQGQARFTLYHDLPRADSCLTNARDLSLSLSILYLLSRRISHCLLRVKRCTQWMRRELKKIRLSHDEPIVGAEGGGRSALYVNWIGLT